jgi:hypothetical protein
MVQKPSNATDDGNRERSEISSSSLVLPSGQIIDESGDNNRDPILPSGQIVDSKNTLQSFHSANGNEVMVTSTSNADALALVSRHPPVLPSGDLIDAKNIHQSFRVPRNQVTSAHNPSFTTIESNHLENRVSHASATYNVEAFVVQSLPLAEVLNDEQHPPEAHQRRRRVLFWLIVGALVVIASVAVASISVYCGLENCSSGSGTSINDTSTLGETRTRVPTNSPTVSPLPTLTPRNNSQNAPVVIETHHSIVTAFLNNITLTGRTLVVNGITPEDAAMTWMIEDDSFLLNVSSIMKLNSDARNDVGFRVQQRYALLTLFFQQLDEGGAFNASWTNSLGWLVDDDECNWFGITCESTDLGGTIGTQNVVIELNINNADQYAGNNVSGTLSSDLGLLSMLQVAGFQYNTLAGTIPDALSLWTDLVYFDVSYNALTGLLPESTGRWTALSYIDVSYNGLMGPIPIAWGQWTNMASFKVTGNDLSGSFYLIG